MPLSLFASHLSLEPDMTTPSSSSPSAFHAGEQAVQARLGLREQMHGIGQRAIRRFMPDQHQRFFEQLPFMLVGSADAHGRPWASMLVGPPGFVQATSATRLDFHARPIVGDPLAEGLVAGAPLGFLGIELHTRRRNRVNGHVVAVSETGFDIDVDQSLGNCPQYIQGRAFEWTRAPDDLRPRETIALRALDAEARQAVARADTLFIATRAPGPAGGADVSHRGGRPGFVKIEDDRTFVVPDFAGNAFFMTLGNLQLDPRAGVLFIDFETGDLLSFTGRAEVLWDAASVAGMEGAERSWRFHIESGWRWRAALPMRWSFRDWSPQTLATGQWPIQAAESAESASLAPSWRPWRVTRIVDESSVIRSFHLAPADGAGMPTYRAGQHLPIRLTMPDGTPLRRTYTISHAPSDAGLRLSVKRDGVASSYLHDHVRVGDVIEALSPRGDFVIDAAVPRPAVLIGAGVGITPMVAFARHLLAEGQSAASGRPIHLIQVARDESSRAFGDELQALVERSQGRLRWHLVMGDRQGAPAHAHAGPLTIAQLKQWLPFDDHEFFLCGPAGFMQALYDGLRELGVRDVRIRAEAFGPSSLKRRLDASSSASADADVHQASSPAASLSPAPTRPVATQARVIFKDSNRSTEWTADRGTLLALAESEGLAPPFSCRAGHCGSCATRLLAGDVSYPVKPAFEPAAGEVLLCCAVPAAGTEERLELAL